MSDVINDDGPLTVVKPVSLEEILKPMRRTRVVDIGANPIDGEPPYKAMLEAGLCDLTGFEPQESALAQLNARKGPREFYLPYAVGDGSRRTLSICHASGMTSLLKPNLDALAMFNLFPQLGAVVGNLDIDTRRLDDIEEVQAFDLLKIDVQGSELSIFRNGRQKLKSAVAIQTEISFVTLYHDQPSFGEIDLELRAQGFIPHHFPAMRRMPIAPIVFDGNPWVPQNQLFEADIVYVRDFSKPDLLSTEQLQHLALIAHYCYGSFDLAAVCVRALALRGEDRDMGARYLTSLTESGSVQRIDFDTTGTAAVPKKEVNLDHLLTEARARHRKGELAEAENLYRSFIEFSHDNAEVLTLLGTLCAQRGNFQEAIRLIERSLEIEQRQPFALNSFGNALNSLGRYEEALRAFDKVLALDPKHAAALNNRGTSLRGLRRPQDALASIDKAITANPEYAEGYNNRGLALHDLGRREDALRSYDRAISLKPAFPDVLKNRGNVLRGLKRFAEALRNYDKAIALAPDAGAYHGRSFALMELKRFDEALADIETAVRLDPQLPYALGQLLVIKTQLCHWQGLQETRRKLIAAVERDTLVCTPFAILRTPSSPDIRRRCAELHVADRYPPRQLPASKAKRRNEAPPGDRIRVAYLSADFHTHAVASLIAGVFEHHDRHRFELHGFCFGPQERGGMRERLKSALEHFADVGGKSDLEVAKLLRERQVDIAVDLMGFTAGCRSGIFSFRPAPIQVNYLGFPGTMGASYFDYIIADRITIPDEDRPHYSEQVIYLPDSYQCNDSQRSIASAPPRRASEGLPDDAFVFCSFNATHKITPEMFDVWMRILKRTDGSVLWLLESNATARENLQKEAEERGVSHNRLVFAPLIAQPAHLARHRLADLFLDTLPYGAHATASDALWAGLPVVTCAGDSFAGRVAASLLNAIGLAEMVTHSVAEYEEKAVALAGDASELARIRSKLKRNRATHVLFDTVKFTRKLEAAYARMVERQRGGEPPVSFTIE